MERRLFLKNTGMAGTAMLMSKFSFAALDEFPEVRVPVAKRLFKSESVEKIITEFQSKVKDPEIAWLFGNCFPNTLDTTVSHTTVDGKPDTYVITGDIDAMWLRDSTAQVWPYISLIKNDTPLRLLIAGVINRQITCILRDPYANAFYKDETRTGEWKTDFTEMKPGVHERKWEVDSLCYPIRLAHGYWKATGDTAPFNDRWQKAIETTLKVFIDQQRKNGDGPYSFQRMARNAIDTQSMAGYGFPVKPVGLICSAFRPSDDATVYQFLVPSNYFAAASLRNAAAMIKQIRKDEQLSNKLTALATEVENALQKYAIVSHPQYGKVYAFEVNGYGSYNLMDDANVPSLLSMPYLNAVKNTNPVYIATRKMLLSHDNPFFYKGTAAEGIGGPHVGQDMIWPLSIIIRGMTSNNDTEIKSCIRMLKSTHAKTGFMHECFHKDNPARFNRCWFAWANTIFGEFLWKVYKEKPYLLTT